MPKPGKAIEFKGRMLSVTRVRLISKDIESAAGQVLELARTMPQAIRGMPVVIDSDLEADLPLLLQSMRSVGMQPIGVSEGPLAEAAKAAGLAVLSRESEKAAGNGKGPETEGNSASGSKEPSQGASRIVSEPVRSGQQVYAEGSDLIVLSSVSAGAEVIADGCVHIYGRLSGRAIAGARGDEAARIFCRKLEAELIAIAGIYAVAEQIRVGPRGMPAQAYLNRGQLMIESHTI